jgi:hypothetical protein
MYVNFVGYMHNGRLMVLSVVVTTMEVGAFAFSTQLVSTLNNWPVAGSGGFAAGLTAATPFFEPMPAQ